MISAETGDGVEDLMAEVVAQLPEGPHHFPDDQLTDLPVRLLAAEVTREHLFRQLHEEVPYALTVETEAWEEFKDGSAKVSQVVYVARDNQKAIVLGKGGSRIKQVREAAQTRARGDAGAQGAPVPVREGARELAGRPRALPRDGAGFRKLAIHRLRL